MNSDPKALSASQMLTGSWYTHRWFLLGKHSLPPPIPSALRKLASPRLPLIDLARIADALPLAAAAAAAAAFFFLLLTRTWPMQVTLGEEGSAASKAQPLRLPPPETMAGNMGDWPPLTLPLLRRRRLREAERDGAAAAAELSRLRPGLRRDLEEGARMEAAAVAEEEEAEGREVKQMKSSPRPPSSDALFLRLICPIISLA